MANPLLVRLIGEAAFAAGPHGKGRYASGGREEEVPSHELDTSDLERAVGKHMDTVGAGVPPAGRAYPELPPPKLSASPVELDAQSYRRSQAAEEKREVQIGHEIKAITAGGGDWVVHEIQKLNDLADELITMHGGVPS